MLGILIFKYCAASQHILRCNMLANSCCAAIIAAQYCCAIRLQIAAAQQFAAAIIANNIALRAILVLLIACGN